MEPILFKFQGKVIFPTVYSKAYNYSSKLRKILIEKNGLKGKVENHHVIPQTLKKHVVLRRLDFDMHGSFNLMMLPKDREHHATLRVHRGGHRQYNRYVKSKLDEMISYDDEKIKYEFWLFMHHLKDGLENDEEWLPW